MSGHTLPGQQLMSDIPGPSKQPRIGDVIERRYDGRAVRHQERIAGQRYYCQAYPCPNLTVWVYLPCNSNLCEDCMKVAEGKRSQ